jgi:hypothetical protein
MKVIISLMCLFFGFAATAQVNTVTILDSLGDAAPDTQFSVFGTGGCANAIQANQFVGPRFTLTEPYNRL